MTVNEAYRINRQLDSLTRAAASAYATYSRAKARRVGRVQSTAEARAHAKWQAKQSELSTFCRENGIRTPRTW
jgi:hypothetical protein